MLFLPTSEDVLVCIEIPPSLKAKLTLLTSPSLALPVPKPHPLPSSTGKGREAELETLRDLEQQRFSF